VFFERHDAACRHIPELNDALEVLAAVSDCSSDEWYVCARA
jgi:hypothetical protein